METELPTIGRQWFTFAAQRDAETFRDWVRGEWHPCGRAYEAAGPFWEEAGFSIVVDCPR